MSLPHHIGTRSALTKSYWYQKCPYHIILVPEVPLPHRIGTRSVLTTSYWYQKCPYHIVLVPEVSLPHHIGTRSVLTTSHWYQKCHHHIMSVYRKCPYHITSVPEVSLPHHIGTRSVLISHWHQKRPQHIRLRYLVTITLRITNTVRNPDSKARWAHVGPTWSRQDPRWANVGPAKFAVGEVYDPEIQLKWWVLEVTTTVSEPRAHNLILVATSYRAVDRPDPDGATGQLPRAGSRLTQS